MSNGGSVCYSLDRLLLPVYNSQKPDHICGVGVGMNGGLWIRKSRFESSSPSLAFSVSPRPAGAIHTTAAGDISTLHGEMARPMAGLIVL